MMAPAYSYDLIGALSSVAWPTVAQHMILFCFRFAVKGSPTVMQHVVSVGSSSLLLHSIKMFVCNAPNFEKVGYILISPCPYVCMYVCMYVCIHVRDIVLKLHVWIPHGKIAGAYFWFSLNYLPLLNYGPLTNKGMKFLNAVSRKVL